MPAYGGQRGGVIIRIRFVIALLCLRTEGQRVPENKSQMSLRFQLAMFELANYAVLV